MPLKGFMWALVTLIVIAVAAATVVVVATVRVALAHHGGL
jgi:hypothetical protein